MSDFDCDVAVFARNEAATIAHCLAAIDRAARGRHVHVAALLNGTTDDSLEILRSLHLYNVALSVYVFPFADKANAINHFLYDIRVDAKTYCCVDAYVKIGSNALHALIKAFDDNRRAVAASGIPLNGRSARLLSERIISGGTLHGAFCGLSFDFVARLVASGFRLPLRLYRGDGLLGSMAAHNLDPRGTKWDDRRIIGIPSATFEISPLSAFRWRDIKRQYNREICQARGRLESEAIKSIIYTKGYAGLPADANDMVADWLGSHRLKPRSLRERYFLREAIRRLCAVRPEPSHLMPQLWRHLS